MTPPNPKPVDHTAEARTDWQLVVPEPILPGVYDAVVTAVELRTNEGDGREWLAWSFVLDDGRQIGGGATFAIGPRTKAFAWLTAILGRRAMGGGAVITATDIVDRPCSLAIGEDAEGFAHVDAVLPPRGGHPAPIEQPFAPPVPPAAKKPESPSIAELIDEIPE